MSIEQINDDDDDELRDPSLSSGRIHISTEDIPLHNACTGTRSAVEAFLA